MNIENQYLNYVEYISLGGSKIGEMPFNLLEFEAQKTIDKYTFGRLKGLETQTNEVKLCMYKLINCINSYKEIEEKSKLLASESIDGYSVSYSAGSGNYSQTKSDEIKGIIRTYLSDVSLDDGTPYLYRGTNVK